jgi:glycosyltransferase involved in cell wall biosynthesis
VPVTINEDDRTRLAALGVESYTVPLALELAPDDAVRARAAGARHDVAVRLLFVGAFRHALNRDAARFLVKRLAPELRDLRIPFALVVAGRHAPAWLRKAAGAGVSVISDAPDLDPLYAAADVVLAPLSHGGGTKYKTLEAMAWGLPVLGTPQAFTGLPQLDGQAFVCEQLHPVVLAARVRQLAQDPELRLRIGARAREYVAEAHSPRLAERRAGALFTAVAAGGGIREAEAAFREFGG